MRIIVLHGNDTEKSYARLSKFTAEAKKRGWDIVNDKIEDTPSLFGIEKLIIIRDYKSLQKEQLALVKKLPGTLVIYSQTKIPVLSLKALKADTIELFELPELLWKFLDNMTVSGFHKLLETQAVEYILAMIAWKLKQKYNRNSNKENAENLITLAEIDVKAKTGKVNLIQALDLFIIKRLS